MAEEGASQSAGATAPSLADRITKDDDSKTATGSLASAQVDGASEALNGSGLAEPEYDVEVSLNDLQADPNNPLFSAKTFEQLELKPEILKGLYAMNFRKPSKIQERALPLLLINPAHNLIGQSQSGTGKTAAFTLNMLSRVDTNIQSPQALVLAPSRELARQILGVVEKMGEFIQGLRVFPAVPDPARRGQKVDGHIIVGTPGTVTDLIRKRLMDVTHMKTLVLDEADNMLDQQGLGDQCKRVKMLLPKEVQVVLFSATFPQEVLRYADMFAPQANKLTLKHEELTVEGIKQFFFDCDNDEHKYQVLVKFYGLMTISSSIIFVKRRDTAAEIEKRMIADGHQVAQLSGALDGPERDKIIDKFRSGEAKVLITTNVLARGIDVQTVTMVINYDIPEGVRGEPDPETYLHRIGRTGRFGRVGVAISFVSTQQAWQQLNEIGKHFGVDIAPLPTDDWDEVETVVKKVIKSGRAGKTTQEMMQMDGSST